MAKSVDFAGDKQKDSGAARKADWPPPLIAA
jgi:hypothetical protein